MINSHGFSRKLTLTGRRFCLAGLLGSTFIEGNLQKVGQLEKLSWDLVLSYEGFGELPFRVVPSWCQGS